MKTEQDIIKRIKTLSDVREQLAEKILVSQYINDERDPETEEKMLEGIHKIDTELNLLNWVLL